MLEVHTYPQEPQFFGSVRRFAVQLGVADEVVLEEFPLKVTDAVTIAVIVTVDGCDY